MPDYKRAHAKQRSNNGNNNKLWLTFNARKDGCENFANEFLLFFDSLKINFEIHNNNKKMTLMSNRNRLLLTFLLYIFAFNSSSVISFDQSNFSIKNQ